ncbi:hypothetical protein NDU88_004754 [Pleurodeles waltl]|uniref:Uncharacterized protein n=1 Tax=Pleurodeles waltl TaxID=8319 RepID=A0AAV7WSX1_PLEWA|nr:hypothetical protein NDU88_004754 [Pleurodeles waltl]
MYGSASALGPHTEDEVRGCCWVPCEAAQRGPVKSGDQDPTFSRSRACLSPQEGKKGPRNPSQGPDGADEEGELHSTSPMAVQQQQASAHRSGQTPNEGLTPEAAPRGARASNQQEWPWVDSLHCSPMRKAITGVGLSG